MDEQGEAFFKLLGYFIIAPFWIAWKVARLLWEFVLKPGIERGNQKAAQKSEQQLAQQNADKDQARRDARAKQLEALRAALPPNGAWDPEKMRAVVQINEFKQPRLERKRIHRLIGEDSYMLVEVGEDFRYSVDMALQLSETDRAVIKQHELDDIVLEDTPLYTQEELADIAIHQDQDVRATKDLLRKEITKQIDKQALSLMKEQRSRTRVGDLLVSPFSRVFDSPHEAKEYADKLKTKLLPSVKQLIDRYRGHKQTEILEF
jgi:hypothetical protein